MGAKASFGGLYDPTITDLTTCTSRSSTVDRGWSSSRTPRRPTSRTAPT
jgi:hypothetical protein